MATEPLEIKDEQHQQNHDEQLSRSLLAPIVLNASVTNANGVKKTRPSPIPHLMPSPILRSYSNPVSPMHLADMEPPPPIPAAIEELGYRSRPGSSHSIRWKHCSDDEGCQSDGGGFKTPKRRSSGATESTAAWEPSPVAESPVGPSSSSRGRRRRGGFFRTTNRSGTSFDVGDDYEGIATPGSRPSGDYSRGRRRSGGYSTGEETEAPLPVKKQGFFSRLKHFGQGTGAHGRSLSGWTIESVDEPTPTGPLTPAAYSPRGADGDDDYEDIDYVTAGRSIRSSTPDGVRTTPGTPKIPTSGPRRRATITNIPEAGTRDRVHSSRRASFRRIAQFSHRRSHDGESSPNTPGYSTIRAIKAGFRMMGRKKEESKIDREKSAELVAELTAATPAAVILASMFQRDEHGNKRIPILLEQLKIKLVDSSPTSKGIGRAHTTFRIELEYGSGLTRMKWVIHREFRDFFNLHSRYRLADISNTTFGGREAHRLPKFPRASIPYLRGVRGLGSEDDSDTEPSGTDGPSETPKTPPKKKRRPHPRRKSSTFTGEHLQQGVATGIAAGLGTLTAPVSAAGAHQIGRKEGFAIRQRQQLEDYMRSLIRIMIFRPDSNRLCKFLELSALGVRLAAEGSYHGKEGYLIIRSSKGSDYRRAWNPSAVAKRHSPKWFLVRHSYIVCVDSPEEMNIYDVFLVDSQFRVNVKRFLGGKHQDSATVSTTPTHTGSARPQHHSFVIQNRERQLKLLAKNERQLNQFIDGIQYMKENTDWSRDQRFDSFAPVRKGVCAQWLVDGRDYMWNVSRAISMAKDVIYIHDWWLSPELVSIFSSVGLGEHGLTIWVCIVSSPPRCCLN